MKLMDVFLYLLPLIAPVVSTGEESCKKHDIDFIMIDGDPNLKAIEDDIRVMLAQVGFNTVTRMLSKEEFNEAHQNGTFHLSFSESWGAPYDPHSYASGWVAGDEGHQQAFSNFQSPATRDDLFQAIDQVLQEESLEGRENQWKDILNTVHQQAVMLPLWGKRIPTVLNRRLTGYVAGLQQFDYPIHRLQILSGSKSVTIAPGSQTGAFQSVGRLDPHSYRPNEFFANNWVYEGLVTYGPQGQVLPALASSWKVTEIPSGGLLYTFTLRPGVVFHDGTPWDCQAAKLNFDHVLAPPLRSPDYHGWYSVPKAVESWYCADDMEFVVTTKNKFSSFLQDLTYIRPLRMLSPASFVGNADPMTQNSCPVSWGSISTGDSTVTCAGILNVSGTGPFQLLSRTPVEADSALDNEVVFVRNANYWESIPAIERLVVKRYDTSEDVKAALLDQSLDAVWGAGVLSAKDLVDLHQDEGNDVVVFHSDDIQNSLLLLNSGKAPLDDISVRKTIMHAIDKTYIIEKELGGVERPVDNIFPLSTPYCDIDLTPRWDYDIEKASLLNCSKSSDNNKNLALGLGLGLGGLCAILLVMAVRLFQRTQKAEHELAQLLRAEGGVNT